MSTDYDFARKPRRMTDPPQNESKWLVGNEGVEVILELKPERIAYFAREATWGDLMAEPTKEELADTLEEIASGRVLGAAYKAGYGFRIRASRSCMDQMLRLAESRGGAGSGAGAQTTRDNDQRNFNIIVPATIERLRHSSLTEDMRLHNRVAEHVEATRELYGDLVDAGVPPQDARYVALPLGFQTQWLHIMSPAALISLCEQRLCNGLTQHETNYLVRVMRDQVVGYYPYLDKQLRSHCEKRGECTKGSTLFPACGAFVSDERVATEYTETSLDLGITEARSLMRRHMVKFDPDRHLYSAQQNAAMEFAEWDIERQRLERENPTVIYSMAGPPVPIANAIGNLQA